MINFINDDTRKNAILNKIKELKQYKIDYSKPVAMGKVKLGFTTVPSIKSFNDGMMQLYKLMFDKYDEHIGLIDEIEELVKELE